MEFDSKFEQIVLELLDVSLPSRCKVAIDPSWKKSAMVCGILR